jgi:hypothetical protein
MKLLVKFFFILSLFSIFIGLTTNSHAQTPGELIVNFAYAPEKIQPGETWKIYLSVTDPEGKMFQVVGRVNQPDNRHKPSLIYLKKGMEKQFTGYFALPTRHFSDVIDFDLELSILDRSGNVRKTLRFPVEIGRSTEPTKALPPDMEKSLNQRIGTIDMDWFLGAPP